MFNPLFTPLFTTNLTRRFNEPCNEFNEPFKNRVTPLLYTKNKTLEISLEGSKLLILLNFFGGTCGGRTHDKRIKSPLLYQLS